MKKSIALAIVIFGFLSSEAYPQDSLAIPVSEHCDPSVNNSGAGFRVSVWWSWPLVLLSVGIVFISCYKVAICESPGIGSCRQPELSELAAIAGCSVDLLELRAASIG